MPCPLCNDTGDQRYWEGRWRDEKADNGRLRAALQGVVTAWVNPADGGEYERGEVPALDAAREALNSYEQKR